MDKLKQYWRPAAVLLGILLVFLIFDLVLARSGWVRDSGYFWLDDFEITQRHHPERTWHRVIFGSSELVSGYREDLSDSDYVNLGMDYGTVRDLVELLEGGYISVDEDLVLACGAWVFVDDLDTNPTYIWHRRTMEPYCYFQRSRLGGFIKDQWLALLGGGPWRQRDFLDQDKAYYYGHMTDQELTERVALLNERYFARGMDGFSENLGEMEDLAAWCARNGVRFRVLWLPENPDYPLGPVNDQLRQAVAGLCGSLEVPYTDMTGTLDAGCFYDTGHLDYDGGAPVFTEVLDQWLSS